MHTCIRTHTKCRYICKHIYTRTLADTLTLPHASSMERSVKFRKQNNKIIHHLFIYYLALSNTEVLFKGIDKGEEKQGGKNPRNKTHASVVTSSLPCLTLLTWKWGKEGFGFNQHNKLCCWLSDTVNADNKLWKACDCLPKGSLQWPYELTTAMGAEMVIVIFTAQSLLISFSSFLKKLSPQNPEIKSWKQSWIG